MDVQFPSPQAVYWHRYAEHLTIPLRWVYSLFQSFMDAHFPEPKDLPPVAVIRPAAHLPENKKEEYWDANRFLGEFGGENDLEHNLDVLLRATEAHFGVEISGVSEEFNAFLREMKKNLPEFSQIIAWAYTLIEGEVEGEGFYEREDIRVDGIYDAVLITQLHDDLTTIKEKNFKTQMQVVIDLIPQVIENERTFNRTRAKVWHVMGQLKVLDTILVPSIKKEKDTFTSVTGYLKSRDVDLLHIREALVSLANK